MKQQLTTKKLLLSTTLVLLLSACGDTNSRGEIAQKTPSGTSVEKNIAEEGLSPFANDVVTPEDMPKLDRGYHGDLNTQVSIGNDSVDAGEEITINLTNMAGRQDWVGIYPKGSSNAWKNVVSWTWTEDIKNGTVVLDGVAAGDYEARVFFYSSFNNVAKVAFNVSNAVQAAPATVTVGSVTEEQEITVHVENLQGQNKDWIGIYQAGSSNDWGNVAAWAWTGDIKSGDVVLDGVPAGDYDVRVFYNNSFNLKASTSLTVAQEGNGNGNGGGANQSATISLADNIVAGSEVAVNLTNLPGNEQDWIAIYPAGSSTDWENVVAWAWTGGITNGTVTLDGVDAGSYDVRVFYNNSFDVALSQTLQVQAAGGNNNGNHIRKLALFADEHDPHNRLLAMDYGNMKLTEEVGVQGSLNHHADVIGKIETAKYVLMVPKGSKFVTVRDIKTREFIKKINLPFKPRSGDAFNESKNLLLLTAGNRPGAVLIDTNSLEIVGQAGLNISCDLKFNEWNYHPWYYKQVVYKWNNIADDKIQCNAPDFGGQLISGHPRWLSENAFVILDRANRLLHVYRIKKSANGQWKTSLIDTIKTSTSIHQIIPKDASDASNTIFYGMSEGNGNGDGIAPIVYKWEFTGSGLEELGKTPLITTKTVQMMKKVGAYRDYVAYNDKVKQVSNQYYKYYYPSRFGNNYNNYYPRNRNNYYENYYNGYNNYRQNNIVNYKEYYVKNVPVNVQQTLKSLGGHNLYITPELGYLYAATASGQVFSINSGNMSIKSVIAAGKGAGHVNFMNDSTLGVITNHKAEYVTVFDYATHTKVQDVNLNFNKEGISSVYQSHAPYSDEDGRYFYNTWTDGGVFFRIDMDNLAVDSSFYVGGVPIQGNYFPEKD